MYDEIFRELVTGDKVKSNANGVEVDISTMNNFVSTRPHDNPNGVTKMRELRLSNIGLNKGQRNGASSLDGLPSPSDIDNAMKLAKAKAEYDKKIERQKKLKALLAKGKDFIDKNKDLIDSLRDRGANFKVDDGSGNNDESYDHPLPTPFYQKPSTYIVGALVLVALYGAYKLA